MSNSGDDDIIDLTESFILVDHNNLHDTVIDLVSDPDDSIIGATRSLIQNNSRSSSSIANCSIGHFGSLSNPPGDSRNSVKQKRSLIPLKKNNNKQTNINNNKSNSYKFGECPICGDELGANPLASTKCGHVYCLKCLQNALEVKKLCPCCRCVLKGTSAYHRLYLTKHK